MRVSTCLIALFLAVLSQILAGCHAMDRDKYYVFEDQKARFYDPAQRKFVIRGSRNTHFFFTLDTNYHTTLLSLNRAVIWPETVDYARRAKDCRPAKDDPEGNWGPESHGLQLGMRFEKQTFAIGDPILATITLRCVGDDIVGYRVAAPDVDLHFVAFHDGQRVSGGGYPRYLGVNMRLVALYPGTQRKQAIDIRPFFEFGTEGTYEVFAVREIPNFRLRTTNEVRSGTAKIHLTLPH